MGSSKQSIAPRPDEEQKPKRLRGPRRDRAMTIARGLVQGKSQRQVLEECGYSESVAKKNPAEIIRTEAVQLALRQAMRRAGVDEISLATALKNALAAERVELARREGRITDERTYADHTTRLRAVELSATLAGAMPSRKEGADSGPRYVINLGEYTKVLFAGPRAGSLEEKELMARLHTTNVEAKAITGQIEKATE